MKKIAIVDDYPDTLLLLENLLQDDYLINCYSTGDEALKGIQSHPPDLVLLDISLPGMDGIEVLRHLRENEKTKDIPVVALTAHAMKGDKGKFLDVGFNGYISKPIIDDSLLYLVISELLHPQKKI